MQHDIAVTDDYVALLVHRDSSTEQIGAAMEVLRLRTPAWQRVRRRTWVPRPYAAWAPYSAAQAINLIEARARGVPKKTWVRGLLAATPDSHYDFDAKVQEARRLERRLLYALQHNPLIALVGRPQDAGTAT